MVGLKSWVAAVLVGSSVLASSVWASPTAPVEGTDYSVLSAPLALEPGKKIDVLELFWYDCPHCFILDPLLAQWVKQQGDKINFHRIHINWDQKKSTIAQQKMYLALEAMGKAEALHALILRAEQVEHKGLLSDEACANWVAEHGVDRKAFVEIENGFDMSNRVRKANNIIANIGANGVPLLVIGGRYVTAPWMVAHTMPPGSTEEETSKGALQVAQILLAKATKEHK